MNRKVAAQLLHRVTTVLMKFFSIADFSLNLLDILLGDFLSLKLFTAFHFSNWFHSQLGLQGRVAKFYKIDFVRNESA